MVDKYGFAYQKNQYRWIHPRNKKLPIAGSDWVAAPATLAEFRRCWDVQGDSPSKQVSCALSFQSGEKIKLSLDTEKDYQATLKMVLEGEDIELTVSKAVPSSAGPSRGRSASTQMEYTEHDPPEWFTKYMAKFRVELMDEISVMIDHKLSGSLVPPPSNPPVVGNRIPTQNEVLTFVDFKRLKIDKKLQKLQKRTQKMSLDLEDVSSAYHKAKGERKLSKISRRMEQLEAKKSKISARKCSREVTVATETEMGEPMVSMPVVIEPEEVEQMQVGQTAAPVVESGPKSLYDACVLTEDDSVLHVAVGSAFAKIWRVKNIGEFTWTDKTELRLSHATAGLRADVDKVMCPYLQPGEEGDITLNFQAPDFPGLFETYWHLFNDGDRFGQWLHCSISVDLIPGEHSLECTSMSSSTLTQHPAVMEIQKVDMPGSQIQQPEKDREYESDSDDDDDISSDSDDSDSFVHIPMPKCYQYNVAPVAAEGGASGSVLAEAGMSASALLPGEASLAGVVADCKTPPSTPMDQDSEGEAETSDTTQIKYPLLDLSELSQIPPMPAASKAASGEQAEEREQTPVHILPETLVSGAMSVAAKAFSSAEAIMRSIQSPMSSTTTFTVPPMALQQPINASASTPLPDSGPASVLTDVRTQNLITLSEMGFFDAKLNIELLEMYNENLEHVIADLVIRAKKN